MSDVPLPSPFEAYKGREPYIFASYAHIDAATVFAELAYLHDQGYRVWYDEGIDPGNEWPEEVAKALVGASHFVVFISPNAITSTNVKNEINYALNHHKPFLAIHVELTILPPGLELRMGDIQAIFKYNMLEDNYRSQLTRAFPAVMIPKSRLPGAAGYFQDVYRELATHIENVLTAQMGEGAARVISSLIVNASNRLNGCFVDPQYVDQLKKEVDSLFSELNRRTLAIGSSHFISAVIDSLNVGLSNALYVLRKSEERNTP